MAYRWNDLVTEVLQAAERPLNENEIIERAEGGGLTEKLDDQYKGKAPWAAVRWAFIRDARNGDKKFTKTDTTPKYYLLSSNEHQLAQFEMPSSVSRSDDQSKEKTPYKEFQLHPLLAYFAYTNLNSSIGRQTHTKTISHNKSRGGGFTEWLHPDMVGVYFPSDMQPDAFKLGGFISRNSIFRLYSFELKRAITPSTYRESFFQAVSNSSWAHEGYLVAAEIYDSEELYMELTRLTKSFGIGIIHLNLDDIYNSKVMFPATTKKELDWDTINKLCTVNPDFNSFIRRLNTDINANEIHPSEYDDVPDEPVDYIREMLNQN